MSEVGNEAQAEEVIEDGVQEGQETQEVIGTEGGDHETAEQAGGDDVITISIKGDPDPEPQVPEHAPEWVRDVRDKYREAKKKNRELEEQIKALTSPSSVSSQSSPLGAKPKLEDFDYDEAGFSNALDAWYDRKRHHDAMAAKRQDEEKKQQEAWAATLSAYEAEKTTLKSKTRNFDDAEDAVKDAFSDIQQGIILQAAKNPALFVLAVGRDPERTAEFAAIKDPVKFAAEVGRFETNITVSKSKQPPPPEGSIRSSGKSSAAVLGELNRLQKEAEKSGDRTKVVAYRKAHKL